MGRDLPFLRSLPVCSFLVSENLHRTGHPSGSRLGLVEASPLPLHADQRIVGSIPCPIVLRTGHVVGTSPIVAHDMGSEEPGKSYRLEQAAT